MAAVMYGANGDGDLVELKETLFAKEVDLQDFLSKRTQVAAGAARRPPSWAVRVQAGTMGRLPIDLRCAHKGRQPKRRAGGSVLFG
jgi:hypothetical protein